MDEQKNNDSDLMRGFSEDVQALMERTLELFRDHGEIGVEHFSQAWREMTFSRIFCGRLIFRELYEFSETALKMVKDLFIKMTEVDEKSFALFLLYALFFKQPTRPMAKIPLMIADFEKFELFLSECQIAECWDPPYVCCQLFQNFAFSFSASDEPVGLEIMARAEDRNSHHFDQIQRSGAVFKFNMPMFQESFKHLTSLHEQYTTMKVALTEAGVRDPALKLISNKLPDRISSLMKAMQIMKGEDRGTNLDEVSQVTSSFVASNEPSIGSRRQQLREQYFAKSALPARLQDVMLFQENSFAEVANPDDDEAEFKPNTRKIGRQKHTYENSLKRTTPSKSPKRKRGSSVKRGPGRPSFRPKKADPKYSDEFVQLAQSLEASRREPGLLEGVIPKKRSDDLEIDPRKVLKSVLKKQSPTKRKKTNSQKRKASEVKSDPDNESSTSKKKSRNKKRKITKEQKPVEEDPLAGIMEYVCDAPMWKKNSIDSFYEDYLHSNNMSFATAN